MHILLDCRCVQLVWDRSGLDCLWPLTNSFFEWFSLITSMKNDDEIRKYLLLCYFIWHYRNQVVWSQKRWQPGKVAAHLTSFLNQWDAVNAGTNISTSSSSSSVPILWRKPPTNVLKLHVDASWNHLTYSAIMGAVL